MKICPICGKKYRTETSCPICHMPLVDEGQNRSDSYLNTQEPETVSKSNYTKYSSGRNNNSRKEISISQTTLIGGIITVVCLVLVVVFLKSFSGRNNSNTANDPNIIQSDNLSNGNDSDEGAVAASDATEDTESQEEEGMTLPYTDNAYMDTGSCLSEADFASVTSEDGSFKFCYPKYIFNSFSYDEEQNEYYFSYMEDGEEVYEDLSTQEVNEFLANNGHDDTMIIGISIRPFMYPNTMFLTEKEAREHLERNHYHYSEDAHTYCMVAWRSPEVEKLWEILRETKWD